MRVMPSVTDTIEPTLRASVTDLKFSIRCLLRSLISVALMAILANPCENSLRSQLVGDALEPRSQRAVDDQIARAQHRAADQRRVDLAVQAHFALEALLERRRDLPALRVIERGCGGYGDVR